MSFQPLRSGLSYFVALAIALQLMVSANAQDRPKIEVVPYIPHVSAVASVVFSPDGRRMISGGSDETVKLWDAATGQLLRTFSEKGLTVNSVAFSPDGTRVLAGGGPIGGEGTVRLWDAATGKLLLARHPHNKPITAIAYSPDGARVLSASEDKTVTLWDAASGQLLDTFTGHTDRVTSVAFSPDGRRVISGSRDDTFKVWDAATGQVLRTFEGQGEVYSASFSPDGMRVLSAGGDVAGPTLKVWDAQTGELLHLFVGHAHGVTSAVFSPDGTRVLSGSSELLGRGELKLWDAATGQLLRTFEGRYGGIRSVAFSPDARRVLSGSWDGTIKLWNVATGGVLRVFGGQADSNTSVVFSPKGTRLLTGNWDGTVKLWDPATGQLLRSFATNSPVLSVAISPDGTLVLSGSDDKTIRIWDAATGNLLGNGRAHEQRIASVAFSPDGRRVLSGSWDKTVKVWDTATGRLLRKLEGHSERVASVAFSPDGTRVLSGGGSAKLWDAESGQLLRTLEDEASGVKSVAFSPDGARAVSVGLLVKVWDVATGELQLIPLARGTTDLAVFSPDGTRLLGGGFPGLAGDDSLQMWHAATGRLLRAFGGRTGVQSVAFSPDGRVVSSADDTSTRIWNVATGGLLATLFGSARGEWLTITPEGFFGGTPKGVGERLGIVRGLTGYSIEQLYQALYDPDLVREALAGDPDREVRKAAAILDLAKVLDSGRAPNVTLISPTSGEFKSEVITAEARITDEGGGIGRVEWRVNGATVGVSRDAPGSGKERTVEQTLALEPGENIIEVVAYNDRNLLASLPVSATVTWNAPANQPKPRLFVIAVGINDYHDRIFPRLSHAVDDAKAFGEAMRAAGEGLYDTVHVTYVLNHDATAAGLEKIVTQVGARMHPRDVFVFLAAAHGKSENGHFHLIPQDYRSVPGRPLAEGTIGQELLQDWFANRIKARRGLVLLDTCESGALVASRPSGVDLANSEAAMGRLNEAIGRPVLTAAAADQAALEGYHGHGVFTYALLDALVNGDTDRDGKITLSELVAHIQTLAPKLSREMRGGRGSTVTPKRASRAAIALGDAPVASRYADYRQKPRLGSRGEDFPLVNRLQALPAAPAAR